MIDVIRVSQTPIVIYMRDCLCGRVMNPPIVSKIQ
jgi:hypothetical protein